jgi:hypothetical protein
MSGRDTTGAPGGEPGAAGLVSGALANLGSLIRNEFDLARAEVSENLGKAGAAVGLILAAAVIVLVALNVLAAALVAALTNAGIGAGWSALIVGVAFAVIAYVMARKGLNDLSLSSLAPSRTARNVQRDAAAIKEAAQ